MDLKPKIELIMFEYKKYGAWIVLSKWYHTSKSESSMLISKGGQ